MTTAYLFSCGHSWVLTQKDHVYHYCPACDASSHGEWNRQPEAAGAPLAAPYGPLRAVAVAVEDAKPLPDPGGIRYRLRGPSRIGHDRTPHHWPAFTSDLQDP